MPVVVAGAQVTEREGTVTALELAERAATEALSQAPGLRARVGRLSVVRILSPAGSRPATTLAARLGLGGCACETTAIGGNTPQMLVSRAAADIAAGSLEASLIVGAEALRSRRISRSVGSASQPPKEPRSSRVGGSSGPQGAHGARSLEEGEADPCFGDERPGTGEAENAVGLVLPVHLYAMFECAIAARLGRGLDAHRAALGQLLGRFSAVAAEHPQAWFRERLSPEEIARPCQANRLVAEPYTKRMAAFLYVDQAAALLVCSLAAARAAGVADDAVFVWSGADACDVWQPAARPDYTRSPGIAAASRACLEAGGADVDDLAVLDLYSCFPSAVEVAAEALGVALDDPRGLTVTGGLPYFGGPGNNYSTHAIATMIELLRSRSDGGLGLIGALGWYTTKHSYGLYGTAPPPAGFVRGDTTAAQAEIDASALPVAAFAEGDATVEAATVVYSGEAPTSAPVIATLEAGPRVVAAAQPAELPSLSGRNLVGMRVRVRGNPPSYELLA